VLGEPAVRLAENGRVVVEVRQEGTRAAPGLTREGMAGREVLGLLLEPLDVEQLAAHGAGRERRGALEVSEQAQRQRASPESGVSRAVGTCAVPPGRSPRGRRLGAGTRGR